MSCLYDELPVVALDFGSLLVCVGFVLQGGGFVGVVALSPSFVTFDVRPSGMASFGGFDLF